LVGITDANVLELLHQNVFLKHSVLEKQNFFFVVSAMTDFSWELME